MAVVNIMEYQMLMSKEQDLGKQIKTDLLHRISPGVYISNEKKFKENDSQVFNIGLHHPVFIENSKLEERIVRLLDFPDIFSVSIKKQKNKLLINLPEREDIAKRAESKILNLTFSVEKSLLKASYENLVNIPSVQNSMNAFSEILISLYKNDKLDKKSINEIRKSRGEERTDKYLNLLENLEVIRKNNTEYVCGNKFIQIQKILENEDRIKLLKQTLSIILKDSYSYLTDYLNLTTIKPYLRWANSYYMNAFYSKKLMPMTADEIYSSFKVTYPDLTRTKKVKFQNQLNNIVEVDILQYEDNDYLTGTDKIYSQLARL